MAPCGPGLDSDAFVCLATRRLPPANLIFEGLLGSRLDGTGHRTGTWVVGHGQDPLQRGISERATLEYRQIRAVVPRGPGHQPVNLQALGLGAESIAERVVVVVDEIRPVVDLRPKE